MKKHGKNLSIIAAVCVLLLGVAYPIIQTQASEIKKGSTSVCTIYTRTEAPRETVPTETKEAAAVKSAMNTVESISSLGSSLVSLLIPNTYAQKKAESAVGTWGWASASDKSIDVTEGGATDIVRIGLSSGAPSDTVTVRLMFGKQASGSAMVLVFGPEKTYAEITISALDDTVYEGTPHTENFIMSIDQLETQDAKYREMGTVGDIPVLVTITDNDMEADTDGDGISDTSEGYEKSQDTDGDSVPDYLDVDDDCDGIPTSAELDYNADKKIPDDTDGDSIPDYLDIDDDNDGFWSKDEIGSDMSNPLDTDKDGTPDYLDISSDDDSLDDATEKKLGTNHQMNDTDNDGHWDGAELERKSDPLDPCSPDVSPACLILDSDKDGILDRQEKGAKGENIDSDKDGLYDHLDNDDDNDGVLTETERLKGDTDGDGTSDYLDIDDDGDTLTTAYERETKVLDFDKDGVDNYLDNDDDNDTVLTKKEGVESTKELRNTDGDDAPDYLDSDDDGDDTLTVDEDLNLNGDPSDDDDNTDGISNYLDKNSIQKKRVSVSSTGGGGLVISSVSTSTTPVSTSVITLHAAPETPPVSTALPEIESVPLSPADNITCPYFTAYIKYGDIHPEVLKIRQFLNTFSGEKLSTESQKFDLKLYRAVKRFQEKHASDILVPWGMKSATGWWYQSTRRFANDMVGCDESVTLDNGRWLK